VLGNDEDEVGHDVGAKEKKQVAKRKRENENATTRKNIKERKGDDKETLKTEAMMKQRSEKQGRTR